MITTLKGTPEPEAAVEEGPDATTTQTWPEGARRYVKALKQLARRYRASRDHYASIVNEREWEWYREDELALEVESLGIENYKLKQRCKVFEAQLGKAVPPGPADGVAALAESVMELELAKE